MGLASDTPYGGIIDRQRRVWWFDLSQPDWGKWSLASYDEAIAVRQDVIARHELWRLGEGPFPTEPYWHRDCPDCPYAELCHAELDQRDDVSLARFTTFDQQLVLREYGITTGTSWHRSVPTLRRRRRVAPWLRSPITMSKLWSAEPSTNSMS
jgi:hypothetical protein